MCGYRQNRTDHAGIYIAREDDADAVQFNHALSLAGKRNNLSSGDPVRAATTMGLAAEAAEQLLASVCHRLGAHLAGIEPASDRVSRAFQIWESRVEALAGSFRYRVIVIRGQATDNP